MTRHRFGSAFALLSLALLLPALAAGDHHEAAAPSTDAAKVERGAYLVTFGGCNDCHTPWKMGENGPEPDMSRMLSGHPQTLDVTPVPSSTSKFWIGAVGATNTAWQGPWGVSFTRNLTPDEETGLGTWTEKEFIQTLRTGHRRGIGRELLPPMPWPAYGKGTDADLASIWAYLRTIPAVSNRVPDPIPPAGADAAP